MLRAHPLTSLTPPATGSSRAPPSYLSEQPRAPFYLARNAPRVVCCWVSVSSRARVSASPRMNTTALCSLCTAEDENRALMASPRPCRSSGSSSREGDRVRSCIPGGVDLAHGGGPKPTHKRALERLDPSCTSQERAARGAARVGGTARVWGGAR